MNRTSEHPDHEPDPLDGLLAQARWAEPNAATVGRLRNQWQALLAKRLRRRRAFLWAAAASFVFVAVGLACFIRGHCGSLCPQSHEIAVNAPESTAATPASPQPPVPAAAAGDDTRATNKSASASRARPSDAKKRAAIAAQRRMQRERQRRNASEAPAVSPANPLERAIQELADHPDRDALTTAESLLAERERCERSLTLLVGQLTGPQQVAAIRLLAAVATPRSLGLLARCADLPDAHADVVRTLARFSDAATVAQGARNERDPALRQQLLGMLLVRGDARSVRAFLECVDDAKTARDALECLAAVPEPPLQVLFQCLCGPQDRERTAAAVVLGRLNRLEISRELILMIARGRYRQEAMIALLSSSEATARRFLADAARNPLLSATLWNAERQFQLQCHFLGGSHHAMSHESS